MSDIKSLIKEARNLIDQKKYVEAQECCKNLLRKDKQNYLALVLLGKSLQDSDQAPLAYQKAIASKPDQMLAWQGLANYYEQKDEKSLKAKLFFIYDKILKLETDVEKILDIISKLTKLGCLLKNNDSISILLNYINEKPEEKIYNNVEHHLLNLIKSDINCKEDDIPRLIKFLKEIKDCEDINNLNILQGKILLQNKDFSLAAKEIINLDIFKTNVIFREWFCKYLFVHFIQQNSFSEFDIEGHFNEITNGIENSKYPGLLKSVICYSNGLYLDAYRLCVPLINFHELDMTEATLVINCTMKLKKWPVVQKLVSNFLMKARNPDFIVILNRFLFLSLTEQQKWQEAILIAKRIPSDSLDTDDQAALARCYIETNTNAEDILKNLQSSDHHLQLEVLSLIKQNKYAEVITTLNQCDESSFSLFYQGKAYWELTEYENSLICLLKAAKIDAEHADTFLYLGKYYQLIKNDLGKSKKCYEKAYSINNTNIDIIKCLSSVYNQLNQNEADFELLLNANKIIQGDNTWINLKLGLHYLNKREWENAIVKFRDVIKINHSHVTAFECLADAYYSRGSFTSALKAYNKVISMDPSKTIHCLTRIGIIYSLLTQYEDAIITFEKVFQIDSFSILALKGMAETWMRIAKKKVLAKLYGSARDAAQNSINFTTKALSIEKKFLCFWNLLAEALIFIAKLPKSYSFAYTNNIKSNDEERIRKDNVDIFPQVLTCFSIIAKQKQQFTTYDLANAYLTYYHETKDEVNCHISYKLIIAAIKAKPSAWRNWNLLGKICIFMKKYAVAQHCFVKALLTTRKWSVAKIWCNLGTLYVKLHLYKLANYCFWRGQSTLPSYPQSWIGQGLIAEVIREDEAMDLFRHASRLGYHPESSLGYADWVCRILNKINYKHNSEAKYVIDGLNAIPYATDLITWYLAYEPNDACANNILGILQERSGLLHSALKSYNKALEMTGDDNKNIMLLNMGRILLRLEKYDDAITNYKAITEASLNSTCGLALALFKKGLYEESYSAYDTALHWLCNNEDEKADLLVAMAGIVYKFKGMEDAKTLLFHSIQVSQKKPTPYSLFAICSLGIIHSDSSLSRLALGELMKYEKENCFGFDIGFLKSYLVAEENLEEAIKILSNFLQEHPDNAHLWFCMAQYCLKLSDSKAKIASNCAQRALCSTENMHNTKSAKVLATASVAEHISGDLIKALILAKQGVHMYPSQTEIWAALIFSIVSDKKLSDKKKWIIGATNHARKSLDVSRNLSRWFNLVEKKINKETLA